MYALLIRVYETFTNNEYFASIYNLSHDCYTIIESRDYCQESIITIVDPFELLLCKVPVNQT